MASMDPGGQRLILHTVDRGEARCAQPAGLTCIDESVSLFLSVAESPPAVGFDDVAVRSSHSRHAMTALLCGCEWFQMALGTTLTPRIAPPTPQSNRSARKPPETGHPRHPRSANRVHSNGGRSGAYVQAKKEPGPSVSWIRAYTWRRPTLTGPIVPLPLALRRFTSGFGMGPGGSTSLWSPEGNFRGRLSCFWNWVSGDLSFSFQDPPDPSDWTDPTDLSITPAP